MTDFKELEVASIFGDIFNGAPHKDKDNNVAKSYHGHVDWNKITIPYFAEKTDFVPEIDKDYILHKETTIAILLGLKYNKRVLLQGFHGTGKSTHIEQVAARLNWPCVRINLDFNITRTDLIGKDEIILQDGKQITSFKEGIIPSSITKNMILVLDEYDAARPDTMFVVQRLLEKDGKFSLLEQNRVITPHPYFRIFATCNTIGLGDDTGLYTGTQIINQGQMDRWNMVVTLNYLDPEKEESILLKKMHFYNDENGRLIIRSMVALANLTRNGFKNGDISTFMSLRTLFSFAENYQLFANLETAFKYSFLNKCQDTDKHIIAEYYQRCFGYDIAF